MRRIEEPALRVLTKQLESMRDDAEREMNRFPKRDAYMRLKGKVDAYEEALQLIDLSITKEKA